MPPHLRGSGSGWVTAEYSMLPLSTSTRTVRESVRGRLGGRTQEIMRLIGRSLALAKTNGNKTDAAKLLNLSFRSFRHRLQKYGIK